MNPCFYNNTNIMQITSFITWDKCYSSFDRKKNFQQLFLGILKWSIDHYSIYLFSCYLHFYLSWIHSFSENVPKIYSALLSLAHGPQVVYST